MSTTLTGWRKSSRSDPNVNCVEIGSASNIVGIRDTKNRAGGTLVVGRTVFAALVDAVKTDRLH